MKRVKPLTQGAIFASLLHLLFFALIHIESKGYQEKPLLTPSYVQVESAKVEPAIVHHLPPEKEYLSSEACDYLPPIEDPLWGLIELHAPKEPFVFTPLPELPQETETYHPNIYFRGDLAHYICINKNHVLAKLPEKPQIIELVVDLSTGKPLFWEGEISLEEILFAPKTGGPIIRGELELVLEH